MTFREEGLQASVLVLQYAAAETGDPELVKEAKDLQASMASQWTPNFLTQRDADALGEKLASRLGQDPRDRPDTGGNPYGIHNPVGSLADIAGGFDPDSEQQQQKYDEGLGGKLEVFGGDVETSAEELADEAKSVAKAAAWTAGISLLVVVGIVVGALVVAYTYRKEIKALLRDVL